MLSRRARRPVMIVRGMVSSWSQCARNLAYDDKQMTSRAIYNHVCVESGARMCACAGVNALHAYLNQSESRLRTIRFVRPFTDFYKLRRNFCPRSTGRLKTTGVGKNKKKTRRLVTAARNISSDNFDNNIGFRCKFGATYATSGTRDEQLRGMNSSLRIENLKLNENANR
jgi:hypothetical protein